MVRSIHKLQRQGHIRLLDGGRKAACVECERLGWAHDGWLYHNKNGCAVVRHYQKKHPEVAKQHWPTPVSPLASPTSTSETLTNTASSGSLNGGSESTTPLAGFDFDKLVSLERELGLENLISTNHGLSSTSHVKQSFNMPQHHLPLGLPAGYSDAYNHASDRQHYGAYHHHYTFNQDPSAHFPRNMIQDFNSTPLSSFNSQPTIKSESPANQYYLSSDSSCHSTYNQQQYYHQYQPQQHHHSSMVAPHYPSSQLDPHQHHHLDNRVGQPEVKNNFHHPHPLPHFNSLPDGSEPLYVVPATHLRPIMAFQAVPTPTGITIKQLDSVTTTATAGIAMERTSLTSPTTNTKPNFIDATATTATTTPATTPPARELYFQETPKPAPATAKLVSSSSTSSRSPSPKSVGSSSSSSGASPKRTHRSTATPYQ